MNETTIAILLIMAAYTLGYLRGVRHIVKQFKHELDAVFGPKGGEE